jgi:hypothetical protein
MKRKYFVNETFFEKIDTEEKAYLLGFLFADGFIGKNLSYIEITLHKKDIEVLQNFVKHLYYNDRPISTVKVVYKRVVINSVKMVKNLLNLGCTNSKTFILKFPNIEAPYYRDFIRGYFDGDGSVGISKDGGLYMSIVGTINFLDRMKEVLQKECQLNDTVYDDRHPERNNNIRALRFGGNIVMNRIYHYFYDGATIFLKRKRNVFLSILENKDYFADKNKIRNFKKHQILYNGAYYNSYQLALILHNITGICIGTLRRKISNGWTLDEILTIPLNYRRLKHLKKVEQYDTDGNLLNRYATVKAAAKDNHCNVAALYNAINKHNIFHKYIWKYE